MFDRSEVAAGAFSQDFIARPELLSPGGVAVIVDRDQNLVANFKAGGKPSKVSMPGPTGELIQMPASSADSTATDGGLDGGGGAAGMLIRSAVATVFAQEPSFAVAARTRSHSSFILLFAFLFYIAGPLFFL
eukprot:gene16400-10706_t